MSIIFDLGGEQGWTSADGESMGQRAMMGEGRGAGLEAMVYKGGVFTARPKLNGLIGWLSAVKCQNKLTSS